jgi:hypothetical protein
MAQNSIEAMRLDISHIQMYLNLARLHAKNKDLRLLLNSIDELISDIGSHVEIVGQHLIDRENAVTKLQSVLHDYDDELDFEEYDSKEPRKNSKTFKSEVSASKTDIPKQSTTES